jgi:DnaJ-class molecular chaperone
MDLLKCYQILDAPQDCTWEELRTVYRRRVQKHHPDRYQQQPEKQLIAKERMLELNKAFNTLAEYYKKNGHLPGDILKKSSFNTIHQSRTKATSANSSENPNYTATEHKPAKPKQATHRTSWGMVIIIAILGYYFFLENVPEPGNP